MNWSEKGVKALILSDKEKNRKLEELRSNYLLISESIDEISGGIINSFSKESTGGPPWYCYY